MQTHGGKGSTQRPTSNRKQFEDNWDRIFGCPKLKKEKLNEETKKLESSLNELEVI